MKVNVSTISAVLLLIFCLSALSCDGESNRTAGSASATSITIAEVETRDLSDAFTISSEVIAYKRSYVASRTSGLIEHVYKEEGQAVNRGDLLASIDIRQQQTDFRRAKAALSEAEDVLERTEILYERDAAPRAELLTARRNVEQAESDLERLQLEIEFGEIRAPIDGVITSRLVEPGNNVSVNERMFTVADLDLLVVRPGISELNLSGLEEGQHVDLHLDVYSDRSFSGSVRRIFPSVDAESRLFTVEVEIHQEEDHPVIRPGYLARVRFAPDDRRNVISVPSEAVAERDGQTYLFVLNDEENEVTQTAITVGVQRDGYVEIRDGIQPGAKVAAANLDALDDAAAVRVVGTFRRHGFRN